MDIFTLKGRGLSQRKIARKLGISRNTVKKYLENPEFPDSQKRKGRRESAVCQGSCRMKAIFFDSQMSHRVVNNHATFRWTAPSLPALG
ncbi:MAG: helix-turn-helix domain-containing protein, partial [Thermodesulfobacteriota bacterium]|nr:helix-turn-helix domain-containing protein [Thermodesulfobacteriota bacterium]